MSGAIFFNESCCEATNQLVQAIKPSRTSVERRYGVQEYVRNVIARCFAPEQVDAYMFGSVPLRTYLPDGDIDLSVVCSQEVAQSLRDTWALKLQTVIEQEQSSGSAPFRIGDVTVINAEVKLLKCLVDNIVVDISCNQIGGLVTLNFLEEINSLIGNSNIFKRSIILVKAWCYYESRLLGAHHGLISTYALETLVLYVFNKYHGSIDSPLMVLYNFLVEFSSFDWDHYCLSLMGPVPLKDLPKLDVDAALAPQGTLLQCDHRLAESLARFRAEMASSRADLGSRAFVIRCLNIMDPLLPNNNLGRSVVRSSFARIRRAFGHGAALLRCLAGKDQNAALADLNKMFKNTWVALQKHDPALLQQQQQQEPPKPLQFVTPASGHLQPHHPDAGQSLQQQQHQQHQQQQQSLCRADQHVVPGQQAQLQCADIAKQQHQQQQLVAAQVLRQQQPIQLQPQLGQMLLAACHAAGMSLDTFLSSPAKQQIWVLVQYLRLPVVNAVSGGRRQQQQPSAVYLQSRPPALASADQQEQQLKRLQQEQVPATEVAAIENNHATGGNAAAAGREQQPHSAPVSSSSSNSSSSTAVAKAISSTDAAESTAVAAAHRAIANLALPRSASPIKPQPPPATSRDSEETASEQNRSVDTSVDTATADDGAELAAAGQQQKKVNNSLASAESIRQPEELLQDSELSAAAGAVDFSRVKAAVLAADGLLSGAPGLMVPQANNSRQQLTTAAEAAMQQQLDPSQLLQPGQLMLLQQLVQLADSLAQAAAAQQQQQQWQRLSISQRSASIPPKLNPASSEALAAIAAVATAAMNTAGAVSTIGSLDLHPSQRTYTAAAGSLERSASTGHSVGPTGQQEAAVHAAAHAAALAAVQQQTAAVLASQALTHPIVAYPVASQPANNTAAAVDVQPPNIGLLQQLQQQHVLLVQQHEQVMQPSQDVLQGDLEQLTHNLQMAKAYMFKQPFPSLHPQQQVVPRSPPGMMSLGSGQTLAAAQQEQAANNAAGRMSAQLEQHLRTFAALGATPNGVPVQVLHGLVAPKDLGSQQQQQQQQQLQAAMLLQHQQLLHSPHEQQVAYRVGSVMQAGLPIQPVEAEAIVPHNAVADGQVAQSKPGQLVQPVEEPQVPVAEQQRAAQGAASSLSNSTDVVAAQGAQVDAAVGAKVAVTPSPVKYTPPHRRASQLGAGVSHAPAGNSNSTHAQDAPKGGVEESAEADSAGAENQSKQCDQQWTDTAQTISAVAGSEAGVSEAAVADIPACVPPIKIGASSASASGGASNSPLANCSPSASVTAAAGTLDAETGAENTVVAPAVPAGLVARAATPRTPLSAKAAPFVSRFAPISAACPSSALQTPAPLSDAAVVEAAGAAMIAPTVADTALEQPVQSEQLGKQQRQQGTLHPQVFAARQQSHGGDSSSSQLRSPQVSASSYDTAESAHFESTPGTPGSLLEQHSSQGVVPAEDYLNFAGGKPSLSSGSEASGGAGAVVGTADHMTAEGGGLGGICRRSGSIEGSCRNLPASAAVGESVGAVHVNSVQPQQQSAVQILGPGAGALQASEAAATAAAGHRSSTLCMTAAGAMQPSLSGPNDMQVMNRSKLSAGSELSAGSDEPNRRVYRDESLNSRLLLDMELTDDIYTPSNRSVHSHDEEGDYQEDMGRPAAAERGASSSRYQQQSKERLQYDREAMSSGPHHARLSSSSQQQHMPPPPPLKHEPQQQVEQQPIQLAWVPLEPTSALGGSAPQLLMGPTAARGGSSHFVLEPTAASGGSGQLLSSHSSMPAMHQYQQHQQQEQPAAVARSYGSQTPKKPKLSTTVTPSDSSAFGGSSPRTSLAGTLHSRPQLHSAAASPSGFVPVVSAGGRMAPVVLPYASSAAAAPPASPQPVSARQQLLQAAAGGGAVCKVGDMKFVVGTAAPDSTGAAAGAYKSRAGVNASAVSSFSSVAADPPQATAGMRVASPSGSSNQLAGAAGLQSATGASIRPQYINQASDARQVPGSSRQDVVPAVTAADHRYQAAAALRVADGVPDSGSRSSNTAGDANRIAPTAPGAGVMSPAALQHAAVMQVASLQAAAAMGMMPQEVAAQQIAAALQAVQLHSAAAAGAGQMPGASWMDGAPAVPMFMGVAHSAAVPPSGLQQHQQQETKGDGHGMVSNNSSSSMSSAGKYHAPVSSAYMVQGPRPGPMAQDRQSSSSNSSGQNAVSSPRAATSAALSDRGVSMAAVHSGTTAGNVPGTMPMTSSPHPQIPPLLATVLNPLNPNMGPFSPVPFPGPAAFMSHAGLMAPLMFPMMPTTFTAGPPVHPTGLTRTGSSGGVPGNAGATAQRSGSGRLSSSSLGPMGPVDAAIMQQDAGRPSSQAGQHMPAAQGPSRQNSSYMKEQQQYKDMQQHLAREQQQRMEQHVREEQLAEYHQPQQHYHDEQQFHQRQYREQHRNEVYREQHQHHGPGRHSGGGPPYGAGHNALQDSCPPPGFVTRRGQQPQSRYSGSDSGSTAGHHPSNLGSSSGRRNSQGSEAGMVSAVYQQQQASSGPHRSPHHQHKQQPVPGQQVHTADSQQQQSLPDAAGSAVSHGLNPAVAAGAPARGATGSPSGKRTSGTGVYVPGAATLLPEQQQQLLMEYPQQVQQAATGDRQQLAEPAHNRPPSNRGRGQLQPHHISSDAQLREVSTSSGVQQGMQQHTEGHAPLSPHGQQSEQALQQQQHKAGRFGSVDSSRPAQAGLVGQEGPTALPAASPQSKTQVDAFPAGAAHRHEQQHPVDHSSSTVAADALPAARGAAGASLTPGRPRVPVATVVSLVQATQEDRERQSRQKERRVAAAAAAAAALGSKAQQERSDQQQQRENALLKAQQLSDSAYVTVQQHHSTAQEFMQQDAAGDTLQALPLHMSRLRSTATASSGYSLTSSNCSSGAGTPRAGSSTGGDAAAGDGGERRRSRSVGVTPGLSRLFTQAVHRAVEHRATEDLQQSPMHAAAVGSGGGASCSSASSGATHQHAAQQPSQQQNTQQHPQQQQVAALKTSDTAAGSGGGSGRGGSMGGGTSIGSKRGAAAISSSRAADDRSSHTSVEVAHQQRSGPAVAAAAAIAAALGGGPSSRRSISKRGSRDDLVQQQQQQAYEQQHAGFSSSREGRGPPSKQQGGTAGSSAASKSDQEHHQPRSSRTPPVSVSPPLDDVNMFPSLPTISNAAASASSKGWVAPRPGGGGSSTNSSRRASADGAMGSNSNARYSKGDGSNAAVSSILSDSSKDVRAQRGRGNYRSDSSTSLHSLTHSSSQQELSSLVGASRSNSRGRHHRASSQSERRSNQEFQLADEDFPTLGASVAATGRSAGGVLSRQGSSSRLGHSRAGSRQGLQEGESS